MQVVKRQSHKARSSWLGMKTRQEQSRLKATSATPMIIRGVCRSRVMVVDAGRTGIGKRCQKNGPIRCLTQARQRLLYFPSTRVAGLVGYGRYCCRMTSPRNRRVGGEHGWECNTRMVRARRSRMNSKRHGWRRVCIIGRRG
jgi:hypothetical protein